MTNNTLYQRNDGGDERRLSQSESTYPAYVYRTTSDTHNHTFTGGEETRPVNMSVVWIIKVK